MKKFYTGSDKKGRFVKFYFPLPVFMFILPFLCGLFIGLGANRLVYLGCQVAWLFMHAHVR